MQSPVLLTSKKHGTHTEFSARWFFVPFSPKKEHRTLPVLLRQRILVPRLISGSQGWGDEIFAKTCDFSYFECFFPSQGALQNSRSKFRNIASFEASENTQFSSFEARTFQFGGSIGRTHRSVSPNYCKILGQVSIFSDLDLRDKSSSSQTPRFPGFEFRTSCSEFRASRSKSLLLGGSIGRN